MAFDSIKSIGSVAANATTYEQSKAVQPEKSVVIEDSMAISGDKGEAKDSQNEQRGQASNRSVEDAVKRANNKMSKTHCEFSYNNEVNRVSITVYDDETGEVVREIPPEESLKMLEKLWELTGLMVDEKR